MYVILRVLHVIFLMLFLWSFQGNNAYDLVGKGAPILTWGSFALMIVTTFFAERIRRRPKGGTERNTGAHMSSAKGGPWLMAAVILAAAAALTALRYWMKP